MHALRIAVDSGGCSGFQYKINMVPFKKEECDLLIEENDAKVLIDNVSYDYIKGSTIDYTQELIRNAFVVLNNPNSESSCGCKTSFSLKI